MHVRHVDGYVVYGRRARGVNNLAVALGGETNAERAARRRAEKAKAHAAQLAAMSPEERAEYYRRNRLMTLAALVVGAVLVVAASMAPKATTVTPPVGVPSWTGTHPCVGGVGTNMTPAQCVKHGGVWIAR